jgi:hypothetical protein
MGTSSQDRQLITDISRDVVAAVAPEEMPLFRPVTMAYFEDPAKLSQRLGGDDMLGFGGAEAIVFLTPVALTVMTEVVAYLRAELARSLKHEASGAVDDVVRSLFHRFRGPRADQAVSLTEEQLADVRRITFEKARQLHVGEARAGLLADATVGSLVLST